MLNDLIKRYPKLNECHKEIENALSLMIQTYQAGGKILVCGNGGSAADCEHIVGELMKGFIKKRPVFNNKIPEEIRKNLQGSLPAISLPSQVAVLSAFINDVSPDMMYAQLVYGYAKENDLLIGISTSGNSLNVVNAIKVAKAMGIRILSLTGEKESGMSKNSDVTVRVPEVETYKVQELHLPIYHYLCAMTEKEFFEQ